MDTSADAYFPDPRPLPPGQRRQLWARLAIRLGIFLSLVLFLCLAGRPLLSLCMPFALALLATWLTEPLLRFFHRRWNIPRGIGAIVLILLLVGALGILDFIPIVGAGTVMVPWSVILLVLGEWKRGVAFLAVWGVICLFRRMIEPKIVGDQTGLHPLLSLLAIYVGMKLGGVVAMILAPVLLLMLRNLWRAGMFHATVRDLTMAARDMAAILHGKPEETDPPEPEKPGETVQKMEKES